MKVKKGDNILVTVGRDKGKSGKVMQVLPSDAAVIVEGINIKKKAVKASAKTPAGGIIEVTKSINTSNLAVVCPRCNKPARMGYAIIKGGKVRICKRCKEKI
ncbi:50S ribosomal protein L24 [bacterium CG2_30_37_16]|nr:MAG: 50S ribosomal protein L24 [bacterium CG2_30_37_16]PIP30716.1 MAG: 50S ribosomal protein L24 [bacterium (Candidatus Howlettbacteria) CG23_combo_of_CG06-09_8_20_14_all_37_9]PIX99254.1 MAG: 50S ribosomal protein L24 [bacterium (Candidatus Howlettbacteria) CG_4_10_14_3_um_filter_37_10]PJB05571.1 MAG: 50S ribosomal protein L24 [bacterium (Candidatus Howlettbacteria) CG_4_9_14_3_um_filter_37_10]